MSIRMSASMRMSMSMNSSMSMNMSSSNEYEHEHDDEREHEHEHEHGCSSVNQISIPTCIYLCLQTSQGSLIPVNIIREFVLLSH